MPTLERDETVFVLDLGDGENRFHPDWVDAVSAALDEVEKAEGPRALVTAATGKFYSNGLDLDWLFAHGEPTRATSPRFTRSSRGSCRCRSSPWRPCRATCSRRARCSPSRTTSG